MLDEFVAEDPVDDVDDVDDEKFDKSDSTNNSMLWQRAEMDWNRPSVRLDRDSLKSKLSYIEDPLEASSSIKIEVDGDARSLLEPFVPKEAKNVIDESTSSGKTRKMVWHNCERCCIKFPLESMLNRHKILSHLDRNPTRRMKKPPRCSKSQKEKETAEQTNYKEKDVETKLEIENSTNTKTPAYTCNFCDFTSDKCVTLISHLSLNHDVMILPDAASENAEAANSEVSKTSEQDINDVEVIDTTKLKEETTEEDYACKICNFICKKRSTLSSHMSRKHSTIRDDDEKIDDDDDDDEDYFPDEDVVHEVSTRSKKSSITRIFECNSCSFECSNRRTLSTHKRRHHSLKAAKIEIYSCNECSFKSETKTSLYSHIKRKHKSTSIPEELMLPEMFFCNQCDYKNKNKYELKVHVARKHTEDFKYSCETCDKKFKVKGDLTNHVRFSHREQPVICDVCGKTCLNSNSLYVHQKFAHYKAKYQCELCKRRMVSQENLNEHMLRQHEKRESVVCEECGKTFIRNSRLKIHMRIHTGDRPYDCKVCGKTFARRTALKQHLLIHTGMRPYVCDVCGKAFTQKPGLISHRKCHPGPLPPLPRVAIDHILNDVLKSDS